MGTRAGKYRHEIVIEQITEVQDSFGGIEDDSTWATFATLRARVDSESGKEEFQSNEFQNKMQVAFYIRYYPNITTKMRINWNSRIFNIESVINRDERNIELQLVCREFIS